MTEASQITAQPVENAGLRHILIYFLIAYLGTWLSFLPMILNPNLGDVLMTVCFLLSTFAGPALAAIVVSAMIGGKAEVKALLGRVLRWRVGFLWYLAALLSFMLVWFGGYGIALNGQPVLALFNQPMVLINVFLPFMLAIALVPAIGEEIGWRGFALPALQKHFGPIVGTIILGSLHSLWHLPAFFTPILGPYESLKFFTFVLTGIAGSFIYTWIYNNSRQSILIAILLHAAANAASATLGFLVAEQLPEQGLLLDMMNNGWFNVIIFAVAALILIIATKGQLSYKTK